MRLLTDYVYGEAGEHNPPAPTSIDVRVLLGPGAFAVLGCRCVCHFCAKIFLYNFFYLTQTKTKKREQLRKIQTELTN